MNILIINQPAFNRGDESAHKGLVRTLLKRLPDAHIKVLSSSYVQESVRQYAVHDSRVEYVIDPCDFYNPSDYLWHGFDAAKMDL